MRTAARTKLTGFVAQHVAPAGTNASRLASDNQSRLAPSHRVRLTSREREVLALLCEGLSNKLICRRLHLCSGTVKAHISSILRELGVNNRVQAVVTARQLGLLCTEYESSE